MKKILASFILTILILPAVVLGQDTPPSLPLLVYGNVSLYGVTPPAGMEISVLKDGVIISTTTVNNAGKYFFQIPASYTGALLTYKIGTLVAIEKVALNPLQYASDNINLTIVAPSIPSGSGGPNPSNPTPSTPTSPLSAAAQKVDANKDNKIDVLDFNTLMVNWGKTTTNNVADFNGDGKVDVFDFNLLMINWTL